MKDRKLKNEILQGEALVQLRTLPDECVHTVVTSPPYWGLRDYGVAGQLGLEATPEQFVERLVRIFHEVKRVLRDDGTVWLNMGDSYAGYWGEKYKNNHSFGKSRNKNNHRGTPPSKPSMLFRGHDLKPKDLMGIPWMVAFALRADGWYLRQDIIWHKRNPMPESVTDRCTKAHEYIFLLSKSARYYYDQEAVKEDRIYDNSEDKHAWHRAMDGSVSDVRKGKGRDIYDKDKLARRNKKRGHSRPHDGFNNNWDLMTKDEQRANGRNKRSVWSVATRPYKEAHFATFPPDLIVPCIKAGTPELCCSGCGAPYHRQVEKQLVPTKKAAKNFVIDQRDYHADKNDQGSNRQKDGHKNGHIYQSQTTGFTPTCSCKAPPTGGIVLDPFAGTNTTGITARKLGRQYIAIELNPDYIKLAMAREQQELGLFSGQKKEGKS